MRVQAATRCQGQGRRRDVTGGNNIEAEADIYCVSAFMYLLSDRHFLVIRAERQAPGIPHARGLAATAANDWNVPPIHGSWFVGRLVSAGGGVAVAGAGAEAVVRCMASILTLSASSCASGVGCWVAKARGTGRTLIDR
eukprot:CAMPEP_0174725910 /NCGR_PEP_ID=MMETSP1094-20130205/46664_1 /TAXON_ID=156173 /ORGANISM="Chrysochromulina brevifilum, Strain UTEX LB 985" /LENGTH=138 /DNA_ID=CAMNT_0015927397 /DNA_START=391 /DNA_END=808 /DNA_ORIENTATION=-